jgi:hypothetical protein
MNTDNGGAWNDSRKTCGTYLYYTWVQYIYIYILEDRSDSFLSFLSNFEKISVQL